MSTIDGMETNLNRIRTAVADQVMIHAGIRERQLGECVTKVESTRASKSKHLTISSNEGMSEVDQKKGDIPLGHYEIGAAYVTKKEYATRICISGKDIRHAEASFIERIADTIREDADYVWDRAMIDAACGNMLIGDECHTEVIDVECCIEHNDQGYTPEKITQAVTLLQKMNNGRADPIVPLTMAGYEQLTKFAQFTNSDFLIDGQRSVYTGQMMRSMMWYGSTFKMVGDRTIKNGLNQKCHNIPVIKAEPYRDETGAIVPNKFVRYVPIFDRRSIFWETGYEDMVNVFPIWRERGKPHGTSEIRADTEFGMGRVDNCGVVIMKIVEDCKLLRV